jgi:hypothetical protein
MLRINLTHRVEELDPVLPGAEFLEDQQLADLKAGLVRRRRVLELSLTTQGIKREGGGGSWLRLLWPPSLHRARMAYIKQMGEDCGFEGEGTGSLGAAYFKAVLMGSLPEGLTVGILGATGVLPEVLSLGLWSGVIAVWAGYILWRWITTLLLLRKRGTPR